MNIEEVRDYCLSVKGSEESMPFDEHTLVYKVMGKMFAYITLKPKSGRLNLNLKCDPERNIELQEKYEGVVRCDHSKGLMWNSVYIESDVPDSLLKELINHSVEEVVKKLPKVKRADYNNLPDN